MCVTGNVNKSRFDKGYKMALLFNLFMTWFCWKLATAHFEEGNNGVAWLGVALSAANFAAAMDMIF